MHKLATCTEWASTQEFLRSVGISVDSSGAVIKQAQVTRLADLNSPAELAAVVADASGLGKCISSPQHRPITAGCLAGNDARSRGPAHQKATRNGILRSDAGRWNQERRTAAEELARTSTAITAVQEKLHILVSSTCLWVK